MYNVIFTQNFRNNFAKLNKEDKKIIAKLMQLILELSETPFEGKGKPEALKYALQSSWSRRITKKHRLVYRVENKMIILVSCYGHYKNK